MIKTKADRATVIAKAQDLIANQANIQSNFTHGAAVRSKH